MSEATITTLNLEISSNADKAANSIDKLAIALGALKGEAGASITALMGVNEQLKALVATLPNANSGLKTLNSRLSTLNKRGPGLSATAAGLNQVQTSAAGLGAMAPTANKAATATRGLTTATGQYIKTSKSGAVVTTSFSSKIFGVLGALYLVKRAFHSVMEIFNATTGKYSDLIEATNLFQVAMRDVLPQAEKFVQTMSQGTGMDPKDFMQFQGIFYQINRSMGVAEQSAYQMSEGLTQLSYDFASLRNMEPEYVFTKLKGAIVGEARAMRELGVDITQAALQEEAHRLGIEKKVKEMTQHEKALLRYNVIMKNSTDAQGDMARTLNQPANMMRVLRAQVEQLARSFGALLIPALQAVLPWLIYLANAALKAMQSLLTLLGITMPEFKMPNTDVAYDLGDGFEEVGDNADSAAKKVKKLRDYTLGIDELNILRPEEPDSGSGGGGGGGGGGSANIPLPDTYDFFKDFQKPFDALIAGIREKLQPLVDIFGPLWEALKPFAKNIWKGFSEFFTETMIPLGKWAMKTIGLTALKTLQNILEWFNKNPKAAENLGKIAAGAITLRLGFMGLKGLGKIFGGLWKGMEWLFGVDILKKIVGVSKAFRAFAMQEGLLAALKAAFPKISTAIGWIMGLFTGFLVFLGDVGAGIALVWEAFTVGGLSGGFSGLVALIGPQGLIVLGIAAIIAIGVLLWKNWDKVKAAAGALGEWLSGVWDKIKSGWNTLVTAAQKAWDKIVGVLKWAWNVIKVIVLVPLAVIGTAVINAWNWLKDKMTPIWNAIRDKIAAVWARIKEITAPAWNYIKEKVITPLTALWNKVKEIFDKIKDKVRGVWDGLKNGLSAAWTAVGSLAKAGINAFIRQINKLIDGVNKIISAAKRYDKTGLLNGVTTIGRVPLLASGGSVETGGLFVAGERGPELTGSFNGNPNTVMPLENSGFVEAMARSVYQAVATAMATAENGGTGDIYMDGEKVGAVIRKSERRSGASMSIVRSV